MGRVEVQRIRVAVLQWLRQDHGHRLKQDAGQEPATAKTLHSFILSRAGEGANGAGLGSPAGEAWALDWEMRE